METEYTPGPWAVHLSEETNQFEVFHDEGRGYGRMLAQIVGERGRFKANAQLIAAAPDLLAICEELYRVIPGIGGPDDIAHEWLKLRDVIAKARGE